MEDTFKGGGSIDRIFDVTHEVPNSLTVRREMMKLSRNRANDLVKISFDTERVFRRLREPDIENSTDALSDLYAILRSLANRNNDSSLHASDRLGLERGETDCLKRHSPAWILNTNN